MPGVVGRERSEARPQGAPRRERRPEGAVSKRRAEAASGAGRGESPGQPMSTLRAPAATLVGSERARRCVAASPWFERAKLSRHCGKSSISRVQSERRAFCRRCRTTSGTRPESAGFWQHHERAPLSRTTASPGQRGDEVASSRASGPCEAVKPPQIRGAERRVWPASRRREHRGLFAASSSFDPLSEHYPW